jgi:peptidoglycan/xylan/chitin deacetylase (PgdA/CDA1 family)
MADFISSELASQATLPAFIPTDRARVVATRAASFAARWLHATFGARRSGGFGILMYHRVAEESLGAAPPTYNVTPEQLRQQLSGLLERGFVAWPLSRILAVHQSGEVVPRHVFAVTFDDGYENNLTAALPVLRELKVPATIFLATAFLDSGRPFPSDDWSDVGAAQAPPESWRPLTTGQCHLLLQSGLIELGAHTHTHDFFLGREAEFRVDLNACLSLLAERFGIERPLFAFPFGITSPQLVDVVRTAGACCALTTRFECIRPKSDPFSWGRFNVASTDTAATLAAKLSGWYEPVAAAIRCVKRPLVALAARVRPALPTSTFGRSTKTVHTAKAPEVVA